MNVNMQCVGSIISFNQFSAIFSEAGANSTISLSDAHLQLWGELLNLVSSAGRRKLALQTTGAGPSANNLIALINAATHANTSISVDNINNYPLTSISNIVQAIGNKPYPLNINGGAVNQNTAPPLIAALANPNTPVSINSLTSLTDSAVTAVLTAIGSRPFSVSIDARAAPADRTISTLQKLTENVYFSIFNTDALSVSLLPQVFNAAGNKHYAFTIDGAQFNIQQLRSLIPLLGQNASLSMTSAHLPTTNDLLETMRVMGNRKLTLVFNGRQLTVDPVNGDKLRQVVSAAKLSHTIVVNTMQYPPLNYILPIIGSSANTNLILEYNGSQLTDTIAHGNIVVRGIEVAQPTTSIIVTSVGVQNFSMEIYLEILRAAG